MHNNTGLVVIVEGGRPRNLVRPLTTWGYSTVVVDDQMRALDEIRHLAPAAVILDGEGAIDALEFTLNVHEIDENLPIIIVRAIIPDNMKSALLERPEVYFVSTREEQFQSQFRATLYEVKR